MSIVKNTILLQNKVFEARPALGRIIRDHGHLTLKQYASRFSQTMEQPDEIKKQQLVDVIAKEVKRVLGPLQAQSVRMQLEKFYYVSTADHHGPLVHPFFVNGNLISAGAKADVLHTGHENIVVLACSNVSLNNSSYPRGLMFHHSAPEGAREHRVPFFPSSERLRPVFRQRQLGINELAASKRYLRTQLVEGLLSKNVYEKILVLIDDIYGQEKVLSQQDFGDQITITNQDLWSRFFARSGVRLPGLVYLQLEEVVVRLLLDYHLFSQTEISTLLFDSDIRLRALELFNKIPGAFSLKEKSGTFLFWALPEHAKYRKRLWLSGAELVSEDGDYRVALHPEALQKALEKRELIPGIMLSLLVLSAYHGLKCLGGFSQVHYLTEYHAAYNSLFQNKETHTEHTQNLTSDLVAFYANTALNKRSYIPATGIDILLYDHPDAYKAFERVLNSCTLEDALWPMLPELYKILYPENTRDKYLKTLSREDIMRERRIHENIEPVFSLS